ncbi:MAG: hypothetical protein KDJ35_08245 [Alphaproteobacteria bacterium]|nr:hypothetical protein [Alphaproteobacteria bacterium]
MMSKIFVFSFFLLSLCLFSAAPVSAEAPSDKEAIEELNKDIDEQMAKATEERRAAAEETFTKINDLMSRLEEREKQHFFLAYTNYNLIQTVKVVQTDVGTAIDKCGENNPDMKTDLDARFKNWNGDLSPLIKEAEGKFKNMLIAQDYAPQKELKDIFKSVDNTRDKTHNQIEKIPVTTPEACQYLLSKMDETQENMNNILRSTLINFPQISERLDQRAEEKKKEKSSE